MQRNGAGDNDRERACEIATEKLGLLGKIRIERLLSVSHCC
jgi:hypothetical protein